VFFVLKLHIFYYRTKWFSIIVKIKTHFKAFSAVYYNLVSKVLVYCLSGAIDRLC